MDVMFVVPAFDRLNVSRVTFPALAWTIEQLAGHGVSAAAVVVADDANIDIAAEQGFDTIERENRLPAKLNDGYEHAGRAGADYAVYVGSDDLIDPGLVAAWVEEHRSRAARDRVIMAARTSAIVSPDGRMLASLEIPYEGGDGVRLIPSGLLRRVNFRPAPEHREKAMDGGVHAALRRHGPVEFRYLDRSPLQIVDLKTKQRQLTSFASISQAGYITSVSRSPWRDLGAVYPQQIVEAAAGLYGRRKVAAAA